MLAAGLLSASLFSAPGASAQTINNRVGVPRSYTCDFLPTEVRPGTVYAAVGTYIFPLRFDEKTHPLTPDFEVDYNTPRARVVAGVQYQETITTTLGASADLLAQQDRPVTAQANANLKSRTRVTRAVPSHRSFVLYNTELQPIRRWWAQNKAQSQRDYPKADFFMVTEVRFADRVTYTFERNALAQLGGSADVTRVGNANVTARRESEATISLDGQFESPLVFCMLVERLR